MNGSQTGQVSGGRPGGVAGPQPEGEGRRRSGEPGEQGPSRGAGLGAPRSTCHCAEGPRTATVAGALIQTDSLVQTSPSPFSPAGVSANQLSPGRWRPVRVGVGPGTDPGCSGSRSQLRRARPALGLLPRGQRRDTGDLRVSSRDCVCPGAFYPCSPLLLAPESSPSCAVNPLQVSVVRPSLFLLFLQGEFCPPPPPPT